VDEADALAMIERTLRRAVVTAMPDWAAQLNSERYAALTKARDREQSQRKGVVTSDQLIDYTETVQVVKLIRENWSLFQPIFGSKDRTEAFFGILLDVRNPTAHSRELLNFERDLLSGIAGSLSNQLAMYESNLSDEARFYPVIETVVDQVGRSATRPPIIGRPFEAPPTAIRVAVGDTLAFKCEAVPARGFAVHWAFMLGVEGVPFAGLGSDEGEGAIVEFRHVVTTNDVGEHRQATITLWSDSRYRRYGQYDDRVSLLFNVSPPLDE
jgi:hypothetical protein